MNTSSRISRFLPAAAAVLVVAAVPATAFGQATRTWVSGVGDDANPCSRTAPCKTFAGAISKTAPGGTIDALDPGGFGALTITKSITIDGTGTLASVLVAGTNGIVVNAAATDVVTLRGLDIEGINGTGNGGLNGVSVVSAKLVHLENDRIYGFTQNGFNFSPSNPGAQALIENSSIYDNTGDGVLNSATGGATNLRVTLRGDSIDENGGGVVAMSDGSSNRAAVNSFRTSIADNTNGGIDSEGSNAVQRISADEISGNGTGLLVGGGGTISSFGNNAVGGNVVDGSPTGGTILLKSFDIVSNQLRTVINRAAHRRPAARK